MGAGMKLTIEIEVENSKLTEYGLRCNALDALERTDRSFHEGDQ